MRLSPAGLIWPLVAISPVAGGNAHYVNLGGWTADVSGRHPLRCRSEDAPPAGLFVALADLPLVDLQPGCVDHPAVPPVERPEHGADGGLRFHLPAEVGFDL